MEIRNLSEALMPFKPSQAQPVKPKVKEEPLFEKPKKEIKEKELLEAEKALRKGEVSVRDLISPASMRVHPRFLELGSKYVRTLFVITYPRYIAVGWFAPIINYNAPLDIAMYFYPVKSAIILKQLQNKVGNIEAELSMAREKGAPRDPLLETALRDIEKLRDDLTQGIEHFFQFALYVTVYADSEKELDALSEKMESIFGSRLVYSKRVLYQAEQGFNSSLPLCNDELLISFNMNSSPCASSFPFISADVTSDNGVLYGINRHNNSLILFDRFSMPNANMVCFATSGAGKSTSKDTPVLVRKKGETQLTKIGPLVEKVIKERGLTQIDEELEGVIDPGIEVYSFDSNLKGSWSKVTVAARKKAPETLYRFTTKGGRSITTTGDHNMLIFKDGKVIAAKSSEIKEGEFIPLPRKIPETENSPEYLNLLELLKNSSGIYLDGVKNFINQNYQILKKAKINSKLDRYLYKYRQDRRVPIRYFWQILDYLKVEPDDDFIKKIKITSCNNGTREETTLPALWKITPEFLRLLGYIVSEGTTNDKFVLISQEDPETRKDIIYCLKKLRIAYFTRRAKGTFVTSGRVFVELTKVSGAHGKSENKRVPPFIFNLSNKNIAEFLSAYFEGDGGVEKNLVAATSKSQKLISDLSYLLMRFGVIARLKPRRKRATNGTASGIYWLLTISGQDNLRKFAKNINFISRRKRKDLSQLITKVGNTNVDIIPETMKIFGEIYNFFSPQLHGISEISDFKNGFRNPSPERLNKVIEQIEQRVERFKGLRGKFEILKTLPTLDSIINLGKNDKDLNRTLWQILGQSWRLMKNKEVQPRLANVFKAIKALNLTPCPAVAELKQTIHSGFKEMDIPMKYYNPSLRDALAGRSQGNTRYEMIQKASYLVWGNYQDIKNKIIPQVEEKLTQLKALANSDLFWDPIVKIKKLKNKDEYVYDLTVDNEVFLAGQGGLFVHNSYAVKLEVLRSLMIGTDVIIIDPEMEYKHLSDAVGGTYVNVSLGSKAKVNPFDLPRPSSAEVKTSDVIRSAVITLKGLVRLMLGDLTKEEDSLVDRALLETYAKKDITADTDLTKVEAPIMSDYQEILEGMEGGESLAGRLKKYTEGTFAGLLNNPTNVEMDNQLVVFSVRDLEDELRPMAIYTIVNYIWNVVRSQLKKRILVIDEAWWLMQKEDSAKFIYALVKRCRKYYLGVTTITQDVNDFLLSPYGKAIVTNSAMQLLMKQAPAAVDNIGKTFMLTQGEKYLLLECGVGEGIFFAGLKHAAIRVVASYSEDQLITSDPKQLLEIEKAKKEFAKEMAIE